MPFILEKESSVPELESIIRLYRHQKTGARLLSAINSDENKVFGITFRTPPRRSDGIAHILEHSVLCGSRKYPVKEPFVELMKSSLNTFLNAMTYPDKTCYPVASTNLKDFYNLVDVYLDAVFYPRLSKETFMQEGWHYEVNPDTGRLEYKGVVFNEMKGAYSDPDDLHDDLCRRSLFPDSAYGLDSGGDPLEIPTLSYEEFLEFHRTHYHPANAFIFFWGDDDPERRLAILDEWLEPFGPGEAIPLPSAQPAFEKPRRIEECYQAEDEDAHGAYVAVNWALYEHGDPIRSMAASVLFHILAGTPAAPLRKALIESGLGEDIAGFGFSEELRQTAFSIGLKGVDPARTDDVEALVLATLESLVRKGIEREQIAASLNTIEFALREKNTGRYPRGLAVMLEALNEWLYDCDPLGALSFAAPLAEVKRQAGDPAYFPRLIEEMFLQNTHRTTVVLLPDPQAQARREEAERRMLEAFSASCSPEMRETIAQTASQLKALQETPDSPEALSAIPSLTLEDIPRQAPLLPSEPIEVQGCCGLYHELPTGGILYLDLGFRFDQVETRLLPYMSLFGRLLLETGTAKEDYVRLIQRIGINTGGIRSLTLAASRWNSIEPAPWFFLRAKALPERAGELASILCDVLTQARLDNFERIRQIVLEEKAQIEAQLIPGASRFVGMRLKARCNPADWAMDRLYGIEHLVFLRDLARRIEEEPEGVLADIKAVRESLLIRSRLMLNITCDRASLAQSLPELERIPECLPDAGLAGPGLPGLQEQPPRGWVFEAMEAVKARCACRRSQASHTFPDFRASSESPLAEALEVPAQINAVGMLLPLDTGSERPDGASLVAAKYLDTSWLWEQVRVVGGAYGGYSSLDLSTALLLMLSYRDPHIGRTIETFRNAGRVLAGRELPFEEIRRSIIGTIGDIDSYQLPDAKGFNALMNHLTGYTQEVRQEIRDRVLSASMGDFKRLGRLMEEAAESALTCVLGSPDRIEQELEQLPQPLVRIQLRT